jgi:Domain of unknown function (DUF6915)
MNSWHHAKAAARRWGGSPEDYIAIERFIDSSKAHLGDARHRAMYHHTAGIFLCEQIFGTVITVRHQEKLVEVPVRRIAEEHILEDLGWIPSPNDYWKSLPLAGWMSGAKLREEPLSSLGLTASQEADTVKATDTYHAKIRREMNERAMFSDPLHTVQYRELTDDEEAAEAATWD